LLTIELYDAMLLRYNNTANLSGKSYAGGCPVVAQQPNLFAPQVILKSICIEPSFTNALLNLHWGIKQLATGFRPVAPARTSQAHEELLRMTEHGEIQHYLGQKKFIYSYGFKTDQSRLACSDAV
jgi:hypothetical protein